VGQLVDQQLASGRRVRRELAAGEEDVGADGERLGAQRARGLGRDAVGMDPHAGQRDPQHALHLAAQRMRQRLAGTALAQRRRDGRVVRVDPASPGGAAIQRRGGGGRKPPPRIGRLARGPGQPLQRHRVRRGRRGRFAGRIRGRAVDAAPPARLHLDPRAPARYPGRRGLPSVGRVPLWAREQRAPARHRRGVRPVGGDPVEVAVDLGAGSLADAGRDRRSAYGEARGDLVEPPARLLDIVSVNAGVRIGAHALPDRERQLGRKSVTRALGDRVESRLPAEMQTLARSRPSRHRALARRRGRMRIAVFATADERPSGEWQPVILWISPNTVALQDRTRSGRKRASPPRFSLLRADPAEFRVADCVACSDLDRPKT
jgi:hypothetical protein